MAYEIAHHATGFATQLELYRLPRAPDSPAMESRLARRNENPYLWVLARPSGEVGLAIQPDPEVIDFSADVPLRPLPGT